MSAVTNPPVRSESKSGKKRRSKPETSESASVTPPPEPQSLAPDSVVNGERERVVPDPPFLKELHKCVRSLFEPPKILLTLMPELSVMPTRNWYVLYSFPKLPYLTFLECDSQS